jgi:hypothetical protein
VHLVAWALVAVAVALCVTGSVVDGGPLQAGAIVAGCVLLVIGLWVAATNGRRIERRWQTRGVRGELELTSVSPQTKDRLTVVGTLHLPDRPVREARFTAYVQAFEHGYVVAGSRVPVTALDEDKGRIRVYHRPDLPAKWTMFVED